GSLEGGLGDDDPAGEEGAGHPGEGLAAATGRLRRYARMAISWPATTGVRTVSEYAWPTALWLTGGGSQALAHGRLGFTGSGSRALGVHGARRGDGRLAVTAASAPTRGTPATRRRTGGAPGPRPRSGRRRTSATAPEPS